MINSIITTLSAGVFATLGDDIIDGIIKVVNKVANAAIALCKVITENITAVQSWGSNEVVAAFTAAGTTLMALLIAIEICQQAMGFHFEDFNEAARFLFKVVIYKVFVENSTKIAGAVIDLFSGGFTKLEESISSVTSQLVLALSSAKSNTIGDDTSSYATMDEGLLGINKFLLAVCMTVCCIILAVILIKIIMSMAGILFEIGIHTAIAPVAVATLVNHETRSLGIGFIKSLAGVCITIGVYSLCFNIYSEIYKPIQDALNGLTSGVGNFNGIGYLVGPIVCMFLLDIAIKNASSIVQRALG